MNEETGYNGWSNYPTWCVALWIDNDQGTYEVVRESVRAWGGGAALVDELQRTVEDMAEAILPALFESGTHVLDLYQWAIGQVDWFELADHYREEVTEDA